MWLLFDPTADVVILLLTIAASLVIGRLPRDRRHLGSLTLERIASRQGLFYLFVGVLAFVGSALVSLGWQFPQPRIHDEFSYLLAADTFSHGRLSNPTHPFWEHFESFQILQRPVHASKYPPAQGLIMAVGQILGGHPIVGVWLSAALGCAAVGWMLMAWLPPAWAVYGTLLAVLRLGIGGYWSQGYFGGWVAAAGGALFLGGLRRTIDDPRISHSLWLALGLAILSNSRPFEGLVLALPCAVLMLAFLTRRWTAGKRDSVRLIVLPIVAVLTVNAIWILYYNRAVTGDALKMPHRHYAETYKNTPYFLTESLAPPPEYNHRRMKRFHVGFENRAFNSNRTWTGWIQGRKLVFSSLWKFYLGVALSLPFLLIPGARRDPWVRLALILLVVYMATMLMMTWNLPHYYAAVTAVVFFLIAEGVRLIYDSPRWHRTGVHLRRILPLCLVGGFVYGLMDPQDLWPAGSTQWHLQRARILEDLEAQGGRHLVLVRYRRRALLRLVHQEWVYNRAQIDTAQVVWAREMDPARNKSLVHYFEDREVWLLMPDSAEPLLQPYED